MTAHTPGPWRWELNEKSKTIELCGGERPFDLRVLDFVRWGMSSAAPRFRTERNGPDTMHRAEQFGVVVPGREHHADWFKGIDHPDARLIAAAPELLEALRLVTEMADAVGAVAGEVFGVESEPAVLARRNVELAKAAIAKAEGSES